MLRDCCVVYVAAKIHGDRQSTTHDVKEANGFTRDPSGANLPADRGAFSAFKAIEIFEDHPSPRLGVVELAEECSRKRNY